MSVSTQQILKAILDHAPENIVLIDRHHKVICYNERMRQTLFHFHGRYIEAGDDYRDFVVDMAMSAYLEAFAKALHGEITDRDLETIGVNYRHWYHYRVNPVYAPDSKLIGVSLSAANITEKKLAQQELAESEAKFRALVEQSLIGVFIIRDGNFIYANPAFEGMIATRTNELIASHAFTNFVHDDDVALFAENCREVMNGTQDRCHLTISIIRGDGAIRSLETAISLIRYNGQSALLGSALDITERLDEEARMNEAVDQAQEMERTQIGMELHDNVMQQLVGTALNLKLLMNSLPNNQAGRSLLQQCLDYLQQAVGDVRQLSHRLAPAIDEETGIEAKVIDLVSRMNVKGNLQVNLAIGEGYEQSKPEVQLVLYRIIQEQFSNIVKYAQASHVEIRVHKDAGHLIITVSDDGVGYDLSKKTNGIGLHNIRRRVQVLGGSVQMQSSPGNGFSITASIPL
jgi:PAS domain S-box-containing protein